jgi:hypothetical protein
VDTNLRASLVKVADKVMVNPFGVTKCDDFSDEEIYQFWIEPAGVSAIHLLQPTRLMPMQVIGGKGSGKTHLLRYFSRPVQLMRQGTAPSRLGTQQEFIGIYVKCDSLNASRFSGKGQQEDIWSAVFQYFLDLWLAQILLSQLPNLSLSVQQEIASRASDLFDEPPPDTPQTLEHLVRLLRGLQRDIDVAINNLPLTRKLDVRIKAGPSRLTFGLPHILGKAVAELRNTVFLYLLDEIENFDEQQQKYVNTLIRHRKGTCSFRVGSRLYGIKTNNTLEGETNRRGSEFDVLELDSHWLRAREKYIDFCERLCIRRLQAYGHFSTKLRDDTIRRQLHDAFEEPSSARFYQDYTATLVSKYEDSDRPYFRKLRDQLARFAVGNRRLGVLSNDDVRDIIRRLQRTPYPLLEKLNVFLLYKAWAKRTNLQKASESINKQSVAFVQSGGRKPKEYVSTYQHFSGDLLAQLTRETNFKVRYLGIDTFIRMSSGLPRNLLIILKNAYDWAIFNDEQPFAGKPISIDSQERAVVESCSWFFEEARPEQNAEHVQRSVDRLATLFREIRYSDKPSECSLSTFSCPSQGTDETSKQSLRLAEDWSMLIRHVRGQKDRNSQRVDQKYQLSPMLAPRWDLPISRRGALALTAEEVNLIFGRAAEAEFVSMKETRIQRMNVPFKEGDPAPSQALLEL